MNEIERNWFTQNRVPRVPAVYASRNYTLKAHQQRVRNFMSTHDRLLVVHGTGSGKTLSGSFIAKDYLDENPTENIVIFVTPAAVQDQFKRSFSTVQPGARGVYFTTYKGLTSYLHKIYTSRRETFKGLMSHCMIIADEAHYITEKTHIAEVFHNILKAADKVVLMTGTPIMNGEISDLFTYAKILNPTSTINAKDFKKKYTDYFKCKISIHLDVDPSNLTRFPRVLPTERKEIKFTNEQAKKLNEYRLAKYQTLAWTGSFRAGHTAGKGWAFNRNIYSSKIFGNQNEPKHEEFLKIYRERPYKTIVFFRQYVTLNKFKSFLTKNKLKYKELSGKTNNKSALIKNDPPNSKMIYLLTSSAKEGLDFKGVRTVIFMDYPWVPSNYNQIVGRARRYESHINLPTANQNIKVYELMYTHPNNSKKTLNSRSMNIVVNKKIKTNSIIENLKNVSIERQRCPDGPRRRSRRVTPRPIPNRLRVRPNRLVSLESVIGNVRTAIATDPATGKEYHLSSLNVPKNQPLIMNPVTIASMTRTRTRSAPKPKKQKTKPYSPKGGYGINVLFNKRNRRTKPYSPKRGGYGINVLFKSPTTLKTRQKTKPYSPKRGGYGINVLFKSPTTTLKRNRRTP